MLSYRVRHAFAHQGRWYTRQNEEEVVRRLPRKLRDRYVAEGVLEEVHTEAPETPEPEEE